jgi:hypothetical protein
MGLCRCYNFLQIMTQTLPKPRSYGTGNGHFLLLEGGKGKQKNENPK